ncbi:unnamed protein product [Caenorhabditis angaria]|uniref:Uncharacterized protein n=1 Tax=Caenorhabditis angaria TaxID=860376 RepID=A0A9P1IJY3_9PELO|nr:unnamed protein product [Caenorhabditis angaria]
MLNREIADEFRRNAPKITNEQIIDDLRGLFEEETAELFRNQNANDSTRPNIEESAEVIEKESKSKKVMEEDVDFEEDVGTEEADGDDTTSMERDMANLRPFLAFEHEFGAGKALLQPPQTFKESNRFPTRLSSYQQSPFREESEPPSSGDHSEERSILSEFRRNAGWNTSASETPDYSDRTFDASSLGNSEHPNTSARVFDFDNNVSDSNIVEEDVVVVAPESGPSAEESVEPSVELNSNISASNIVEKEVSATLEGVIEQVLEMAAKSTKSLNQEVVNESPSTSETPVDRPSTYEPTLSSALAFLARLGKLLPCSQPIVGANAQIQQPNRQGDPGRVSAPESGNVEDVPMPEISGLPETGSTAEDSRIEKSSNSPPAIQQVMPGSVVIRSPGNEQAVQESRIETSSNCPPDNQHVMQPGNVVISSPAAAQHSQQAVRKSKFRRHVSRLLNPVPRYETASESSEKSEDDFERRAENPLLMNMWNRTNITRRIHRHFVENLPHQHSHRITQHPKSSSSSQPSTPPGTPPPSYEIPRTSNPAISVNSINNGLHSLKISPNLFADGVRFIIDGNEIRAIGTLKHNLLEIVGDETVDILTRNVGVVQMENLIRKRLEREFEASLVDYKGTKIPKIAYEKLIAMDALNAFRDDDDHDQFAQPNRIHRKRKAARLSNDVAVNPKRRKVTRKPARARAPTRPAIVAPPKPIAPTGPPPKSARLAARHLAAAAAATPPASPANQSTQSSKRRSDSSPNQSPTKKAKTGPELKTIDEAQSELLKVEMALQTRSFGFHGLDLLTEHRRMMRAFVSYNQAPTPNKLAKILSKTRSLSDEVERLAQ